MSKKISFIISLSFAFFFIALLLLPTLNPSYKKMPFFNFLDNIENIVYDAKTLTRGAIPSSNKIVIAGIDEESITKVGRWPWSRRHLINLTKNLVSFDSKMVAFDIVFSEEEENQLENVSDEVKDILSTYKLGENKKELYQLLDSKVKENDFDLNFSNLISKEKDKLVFGYMFIGGSSVSNDLEKTNKYSGDDLKSQLLLREKQKNKSADSLYKEYNYVIKSIPEYSKNLLHEGFLNGEADADSIYRKSHLVYKFRDKVFPSISLKLFSMYEKSEAVSVKTKSLDDFVVYDKLVLVKEKETKEIDTDLKGAFYVNFRGPKYSFPHFSVADILDDSDMIVGKFYDIETNLVKEVKLSKKEAFKDKIILIGATASLLSDIRPIPFNKRNYPGVEIHATVLDNLIKGDYLHKTESQYIIQMIFMLLVAIFLVFLVLKLTYSKGFIAFFLLFSLILLVDYFYFFLTKGVIIDISIIYLEIIFIYGSLLLYRYFVEEKDNRFLINTFKSYLSPELIDSMYKTKELPSLGGETRVMTAFFSDVQGFSSFSEKMTPAELVSWLNQYLTEMTTILVDEMGTLDKYEGDAMVAFFGAPVKYEDHAIRACRVALKMQIKLQEMRENIDTDGGKINEFIKQTRARIGLNTGTMLTGNVGSKQRMNYTMMGHSVNLAARLESSAKQYGIFIQVAEATKKAAESQFLARRIDKIVVIGISKPVQTYEILDFLEKKNDNLRKLAETFEKGIDEYNKKNWEKAKEYFSEALKFESYRLSFDEEQTNPSLIYIERCTAFIKNPPEEDWDGVYVLDSK